MRKPSVIIRMGAPAWDARVLHNGEYLKFNLRTMTRDERREFHRTFMNSIRAMRRKAA